LVDVQAPISRICKLCAPGDIIGLAAGAVLFREGDDADAMYVVKTGRLRILSGNAILEDVGPGGILGEMGIIERDMPRSATAIACTRSELFRIDSPAFLSLIATTPDFAVTVMQVMARRLRVMNRRYRTSTRT
jgi:CRP/FNR family transcriptional regulator, cyclic AMP receptor protein